MEMEQFLGGYTAPWWNFAKKNRILVQKYNSIDCTDIKGKYDILKELLGSVDEVTVIEPPFRCDDGKKIFLGKNFYANYNLVILDADTVTIGNNVVVGPNVTIITADHPIHPESRTNGHGFPVISAPITIEDDVWIGACSTILKGVTIGHGSIIGANSLVTKDVPPMTIVGGSPAKVIREITDEDRYDWGDAFGKRYVSSENE